MESGMIDKGSEGNGEARDATLATDAGLSKNHGRAA